MNAIQRLDFLLNVERTSVADIEKLLRDGNFSSTVRELFES